MGEQELVGKTTLYLLMVSPLHGAPQFPPTTSSHGKEKGSSRNDALSIATSTPHLAKPHMPKTTELVGCGELSPPCF